MNYRIIGPVFRYSASRAALRPSRPQHELQLRVQLAARLDEQRLVDRLVRDTHLRVVREVLRQPIRYLFRREVDREALGDRVVQPPILP